MKWFLTAFIVISLDMKSVCAQQQNLIDGIGQERSPGQATLILPQLMPGGLPINAAPAPAISPSLTPYDLKHKTFAMRHPKLHKYGRKFRRTCQILQPIVSTLGSVAQIAYTFK